MRNCPHCNHALDAAASAKGECPACRRTFTVRDVSFAGTIEFESPSLPSDGTIDELPPVVVPPEPAEAAPAAPATPAPSAGIDQTIDSVDGLLPVPPAVPLSPAENATPPSGKTAVGYDRTIEFDAGESIAAGSEPPPNKPVAPPATPSTKPPTVFDNHNIGMTIQADKWHPAEEELNAANIEHTVDQPHQSGITPANLRDLTIMWGGSIQPASVSGSGSYSPTLDSAAGSASAPGVAPQSHAGSRGSSQHGSSRGSSLGSSLNPGESLEQSLVIQPRVLRQDSGDVDTLSQRIDYNLLNKLGEGGMGIVYAARQASIRRTVALKMLKKEGARKDAQREKFLAEAVVTGELEHPNIVPIYDLGRDESGAIFYAMKHVKGTPWDAHIDRKSLQENLEILMKVADGVAFAHSRNVIHRDLKPENIMLGDFGEVLVMDWGLALSLNNPPASFSMGGTPAYMAPEMAMGPLQAIGVPSDVYLLGAILFEIVTGQRPHSGSTLTKCLISAARNEIVTTDKSGELIDIARRAMASNPADRYQTVGDFQNAIRTYQSHTESIALASRAAEDLADARQGGNYESYSRALFGYQEAYNLWDGNSRAKEGAIEAAHAYALAAYDKGDYDLGLSLLDPQEAQHRELIGKLKEAQAERSSRQARLRAARRVGVVLVGLILAIVTGAFFWIRSEANKARIAEGVAREAEKSALQQEAIAKEERSEALRQKGVAEEQRTKAIAAQEEAEKQRLAAEEQRQLADAARVKEEYEAYVAKLGLAAAKIKENAFDHALVLLQSCPPKLRHWEWGRLNYLCNQQMAQFDCGFPLEAVATSPDGTRIAAGGWGGKVEVYDLATSQRVCEFNTQAEYVFALAFSPDGEQIAVGTNAKPEFISFYNADSGERIGGLAGHTDAVLSVAYSKDGKRLLTGSYDQTARLWDLTAKTSTPFVGHDWWVWSAAFSPDEKQIVTASQDGSVMVWSVETKQAKPPFLGHTGPVYSAVYSPDGKTIATASYDQRILLWHPADLKEVDLAQALNESFTTKGTPYETLEGHSAPVRSVQFSEDGNLLLSASQDNSLCVWDVPNRHLVKQLRGHGSPVSAAKFVAGDERVISVSYDHHARLWNVDSYEEMRVLGGRVLKGHRDAVLGAAFSPDSKTVVTASRDRSAIAWNVSTGQQLQTFREGHAFLASTALFLPDNKRVLTAAVDNTARIWDISAGTQIATLDGSGPQAAAAVAPKSGWIVTGSDDTGLKIWDGNGKLLRKFPDFKSEITALAISPDEQTILVGDLIGRCRLIQAADGEAIWEGEVHSRGITAACFLPDGRRILTSSLDRTVAQWDVATGQEDRKRVLKHPEAVTALAISADGKRVLTSCSDKIVRQWDLDRAQTLFQTPASESAVTDVACSADGKRALTITADNCLHLWDLEKGTEIHRADGPNAPFLDLAATTLLLWSGTFSADGHQLLTVGGSEAHLWDAEKGKLLMSFSPQSAVASVQFSKEGDRIVTGSWDNAARVWNSTTGEGLVKLSGVHTRFINASVFSPDGTQVLTASDDGTARLWSATEGKLLKSFEGHKGRVTDVAFSSDGRRVLTASDDHTARVWDVATGKTLHVLEGHTQAVLCARFSTDDALVVTGSEDTSARLWDAQTGASLPTILQGHTASVTSVAFTPDRARVITGSKDFTAKIWDPQTGKEILSLTGHTQEITSVAVSRDGKQVLTGSRDGTAIVWLASPWEDGAAPMPVVAAAGALPPEEK